MPKKFDEILAGVRRNNRGKTNPRTKKPYTESELYAIAQAQYQEWKRRHKSFIVKAPITNFWEEDVTINKGLNKTEKSKQRFIEVTVSGLKEDRDGERMSQEAIDDMIIQFKSGTIPFFPDHGRDEKTGVPNVYSWKQMMGVWVDARQENEKMPATVRLNKAHPDAEMFWEFVKEGMPIGFSIGGKPIDEPTVIEEDIEPRLKKILTTRNVKEEKEEEKDKENDEKKED